MEALPIDDNSHLFLLLTCVHLNQDPHSGPRQALSHLYMPVQEAVPETGSSLKAEGEPGGQSSPGECTVHQMKEAGKAPHTPLSASQVLLGLKNVLKLLPSAKHICKH